MGVFFTSDLHLGHKFVAQLRGFDDVADHDAMIMRNITKMLTPNDELFVLGDVALGGWAETIKPIQKIMSTKHLIVGNHDRCFAGMSNGHNHVGDVQLRGGFKSVLPFANYGKTFTMCHFPYEDIHVEGEAGRFEQYRMRDLGKPLLHGHTHSKEKFSVSSNGTPQINVGVDAWNFRPVSLSDVLSLL